MGYISIDSSTSSTTIIVFDENLKIKKKFQKEHKQIFTPEGYVEHDLNEIYKKSFSIIRKEKGEINYVIRRRRRTDCTKY